MTAETTDRVSLAELARAQRAKGQAELAQGAAELQAEYNERAPKLAERAVAQVLGPVGSQAFEGAVWAAHGAPTDPWHSSRYYSARTRVDGLLFEATSTYDGRRSSLFLLWACSNGQHPPADRRVEVNSLAHLADLLEADLSRAGDCAACYYQREDEPAEAAPPTPPTTEELLVRALRRYVEETIGEHLGVTSVNEPADRI